MTSDEQIADHEIRIRFLENSEIVRDAVLTFLRWSIPILVAVCAIVVTVVIR